MDVLVLIGRILFAALFLTAALGHLTRTKAMGGHAGARGVPAGAGASGGGQAGAAMGGEGIPAAD